MKNENNILKWFNEELSKEDQAKLRQLESSADLEKIKFYASQLVAPKVDADKALKDFKTSRLEDSEKKKSKVLNVDFSYLFRIAAIFVVGLVASYFLFFNTAEKSFATDIAEIKRFNLPDQSEVILNSKSVLAFNKNEWKEDRNLNLEGEAYFKVKKGQKFTVNTKLGKIQVLGTEFNVKERPDYFEVHCYEGLVSVSYHDSALKLSQGQVFKVINGKPQPISTSKLERASWTNNESSFNRVPLSQVIQEFERQYKFKIRLNKVDTMQLFSGSFTHKDEHIALKAITIPLELTYVIDGETIVISNYETP